MHLRVYLRTAIAYFIAVAALICFADAFADSGAASGGWALTWLTPYVPILIPALAGVQSIVIRGQTSQAGFWHTTGGHVLLVFFGAVIGSFLDFLQAGTFTKSAVIAAAAGAATAFFGAWKTTGKDGSTADSAAKLASGSGTGAKQSYLMLLALLSVWMAIPACAHVDMAKYKAAFTSCLTSHGIADANDLGSKILGILDQGGSDPATIDANLEATLIAAGGAAVEQVAVCAVLAWQASHPISTPDGAVAAEKPTASQAAARIFIAKHTIHN